MTAEETFLNGINELKIRNDLRDVAIKAVLLVKQPALDEILTTFKNNVSSTLNNDALTNEIMKTFDIYMEKYKAINEFDIEEGYLSSMEDDEE